MSGVPPTHRTSTSIYYYYYGVAAFEVVVFALLVAAGLYFALVRVPNSAATAPLEPRGSLNNGAPNDGDVDGLITRGPLIGVTSARPTRGAVDQDLDNDETPDSVADSLVGLAPGLLCIPPLTGCLLLCLCELLKKGVEYHPTLERPG